jgi:hypothetical protein
MSHIRRRFRGVGQTNQHHDDPGDQAGDHEPTHEQHQEDRHEVPFPRVPAAVRLLRLVNQIVRLPASWVNYSPGKQIGEPLQVLAGAGSPSRM